MPTNHGSIEFLKFPNPAYKTDNTQPRFIKKWLRDSWARRKILALQQAIAGIVVPTASSVNPQMDGTAAPGSSTDYARADHIHPHDTSKADAATTYTKSQIDAMIPSVPSASTASPAMDGTGSPGSSTAWARGDHVHPSDTSKQDALTTAQLAAVNSGATANDFAVNDANVTCTITPIVPTLSSGSHYSSYGGVYYYKVGSRVRINIGVSGITANTDTNIFTLPTGYRPHHIVSSMGTASSVANYGRFRVHTDGTVHVSAGSTYACGYIEFDVF